jgi:hypothetical protein
MTTISALLLSSIPFQLGLNQRFNSASLRVAAFVARLKVVVNILRGDMVVPSGQGMYTKVVFLLYDFKSK